MTLRELKKAIKEKWSPNRTFTDKWEWIIRAARNKAEHTVRTVTYKVEGCGFDQKFRHLNEARATVGVAAESHTGDWLTHVRLTIIPERDFTPQAMRMNVEDVIDIQQCPHWIHGMLTEELRDKYFEVYTETHTGLRLRKEPKQ